MKELFYSLMSSTDRREVRYLNETYVPLPQSFSRLYHVICKTGIRKGGNPGVSRTTVQRHLNRMVKAHILKKHPTRCEQYNQTLYGLTPKRMLIHFMLLMQAWERHPEFKPPWSKSSKIMVAV